ncbi:unnamed protein product [Clonostachys rosea]|uniref:C3H1-type domain-containing protein n=1 Tax=Bionectria ochroleuca TaxID=29856 RepID=A0ABY6UCH6_BIOOC|nr:unnamed protein product [Clonostachys rosea]
MIFDPALDDYIDYSLSISEDDDDQRRSDESTDDRGSSRDAINSQAGSPSLFLEYEDVAWDQYEYRPASASSSSFAPSLSHLSVTSHSGVTDFDIDKSISDRILSMEDLFALPSADELNLFAPSEKSLDPYELLPYESQQILPKSGDFLGDTAVSGEIPQEPDGSENALFQSGENDEIVAPALPSRDKPNFREHSLYKNASVGSDGLYHCPWEGQSDCNHIPNKSICFYK